MGLSIKQCGGSDSHTYNLAKLSEWFKELVLKTSVLNGTVSSNLTLSVCHRFLSHFPCGKTCVPPLRCGYSV